MGKIAIVGMDAVFGSCQNLDELANGSYAGKQYFESAPIERCQGLDNSKIPTGAYLQSFEIDALQLGIAPEALDQTKPQQLLLLKVIANALKDVRLDASTKGVIMVSDIAAQLNSRNQKNFVTNHLNHLFNTSTLTLEFYESTFQALETAQTLLSTGQAEFVIVSATHFITHLNSGNLGTPTLSYDFHSKGVRLGEGAGAIVLKSHEVAREDGDRIYVTVDAVELTQSMSSLEAIAQSCQQAFYAAGVKPDEIGYLEVSAAGNDQEDNTELSGLTQAYRGQSNLSCAIGSVKANVGDMGAVCDLAGVIKTALCLYHRYIPAVPQWTIPKQPELWQGSPFYIPTDSRPWLLEEKQEKRIAAVNSRCGHLILSEDLKQSDRPNTYLNQLPELLFAIAATDQLTLLEQLDTLQDSISKADSLRQLAHDTFTIFQQAQAPYVVAIVGHTQEKLMREIEQARSGISRAFAQGEAWKSPSGSYFTANPLGQKGTVAFVYPGAFNSYLGMGRSLFHLFPQLHECVNRLTSNPSQFFQEKQLYPRSVHRLPKRELEALESRFSDTPLALLETGTGFSVLFTEIIQQILGVQPSVAFGYSMGESTMLYALKVWDNADYGSHFVHSSQLFHSRLGGIQEAVQEYWEIPQCCAVPDNMVSLSAVLSDTGLLSRANTILSTVTEQPGERTSWPQQWSSHVLLASPAAVRECLRSRDRVYLTHINTPQEVVIAGEPQACQRVIDTLQCESFKMPSNLVLHCDAMASEYPSLFKLNHVPTFNSSRVTFYSSATYSPLPLDQIFVAHHLAKGVCQKLDFPRLVNRVYEDGAKIFIELGSGGTCSRWIDQILDAQDHLSVCINRRGTDDYTSILKVLAQLVSHRVPVDLSRLYTSTSQLSSLSATQTIPLNQYPFVQNASVQPVQATALEKSPSPQPASNLEQKDLRTFLDTVEILELTEQKVSRLFGKDFAVVDTYPRRVRLPSPPYLLISRVTHLEGERGNYKTGMVQTEYDLPKDAWYSVDGQIPIGICAEAGHGILLLLSYLGADFESQGDRSFRLLDLTVEFLTEQPKDLTTLKYNVRINSHVKTTESLLIFFSGECWVGDRTWLKLSGGCAGLFTDEELAKGQGIVVTEQEERARQQIQKKTFTPLLNCSKVSFTQSDLQRLSQGDLTVFGTAYHLSGHNPSLRLPPQQLMMIDRVISVDPQGGVAGLGLVVGAKTVTPQDWYFQCHFKNDPTMPGSLMVEGSSQLLQFYLLFLGLQTCTNNAKFEALPGQPFNFRFRGQVTPATGTLIYQLEVTDLKMEPKVCAIATINLIWDGKTIATIKNLGLQLSEQSPLFNPSSSSNQPVLFNSEQLKELAQGSVEACFGADFHSFKNRRSVRIPNREFCLISRVLDIKGQRHAFQKGTTITTEYDVSSDAWFYRDNSYPALPYCTHIETAGQPCIFLGLELGTTLLFPDEDLYFRNLDGQAQVLKEIDLRGKTITDQVELLASTALEGATLQTFAYQLACEGEPFYRGTMVFGYFSHKVLASQVGLDNGIKQPWYETNAVAHLNNIQIDFSSPTVKKQFYQAKPSQPHYRLADGYLNFLNRALIIEAGGNYQKGYIYAEKKIEPSDWYFPYHFYQDPVMPGALGVEAILQAMQVYALHQNLGHSFKSPRFGQALNHSITWKYRGQITPQNRKIYLEVHLSDIRKEKDKITLIGDASLWKENMRIYEVKNIAICLQEAEDSQC